MGSLPGLQGWASLQDWLGLALGSQTSWSLDLRPVLQRASEAPGTEERNTEKRESAGGERERVERVSA